MFPSFSTISCDKEPSDTCVSCSGELADGVRVDFCLPGYRQMIMYHV